MLSILVAGAAFTFIFLGIECAHRTLSLPTELTRKLAHIGGAGGAALLPLWLSWRAIFAIALFFTVVMTLSKLVHGFHSIHDVERQTYGEIFLPLGIAALALMGLDSSIYCCALLVIALADPFAQFVGRKFGRPHQLQLHHKTLEGSGGFFAVALLVIVSVLSLLSPIPTSTILLRGSLAALIVTIIEHISPKGLDNLTAPLAVAVCLWSL